MSTNDAMQAVINRRPGQYAREHVRPRATLAIVAIIVIGVGRPTLAMPFGVHNPMFLGATSAEIVGVIVLYWFTCKHLNPWTRGIAAENEVGQLLDDLSCDGWLVLHGVQTGRADIDHLAVGPGGVVTIETKSHLRHVTGSQIPRGRLKQAAAHRKRLQALMPHLTHVDALLVFTVANVELCPSLVRDVVVLSADHLLDYLRGRSNVISEREVRRVYDEVVQAFAPGRDGSH